MSTHVYIFFLYHNEEKKARGEDWKIDTTKLQKKVEMKIQKKNTENSNSLSGIQQSAVVICGACRSTLYNIIYTNSLPDDV